MCYFPIKCRLPEDGGRPILDPEGDMALPCGSCPECIKKRGMDWALRVKHELSEHDEACFLTLTYDDDHLPSLYIVKDEFQKFLKNLRQKVKKKLSYVVSHEYGSKTYRPHHHAIIFGYNPSEQTFLKKTPKQCSLFTSDEVSKLWKHGFHSIGEANAKTAFYIATYAIKGKKHTFFDPYTGEETEVHDSMDTSKRPGIGLSYLIKNAQQLVNQKIPLPRYYTDKLNSTPEQLAKLIEKFPEQETKILMFPKLYEEYQNNILSSIKERGSDQKYAHFKTKLSLNQLKDSEFRVLSDNEDLSYYEHSLKTDRIKHGDCKE